MDTNKRIVVELVADDNKDKEILMKYFKEKGINELFIEYEVLDISDNTKEKIKDLEIIIDTWNNSKYQM